MASAVAKPVSGTRRWNHNSGTHNSSYPPRIWCRQNSSFCSFLGFFPDLLVNFDRVLTEAVIKLMES
jgi:hypothetical protein